MDEIRMAKKNKQGNYCTLAGLVIQIINFFVYIPIIFYTCRSLIKGIHE